MLFLNLWVFSAYHPGVDDDTDFDVDLEHQEEEEAKKRVLSPAALVLIGIFELFKWLSLAGVQGCDFSGL